MSINNADISVLSGTRIASLAPVIVLAVSLLLGACADTDTVKKDGPIFLGNAGGTIDGGGATSGISVRW
jgi:hypothetical protein